MAHHYPKCFTAERTWYWYDTRPSVLTAGGIFRYFILRGNKEINKKTTATTTTTTTTIGLAHLVSGPEDRARHDRARRLRHLPASRPRSVLGGDKGGGADTAVVSQLGHPHRRVGEAFRLGHADDALLTGKRGKGEQAGL